MYYKIVSDGYIQAIGAGCAPDDGEAIDQSEYDSILALMQERPTPEDGYDYKLTVDGKWEAYELSEADDGEEEITTEELLEILLGGETV